jgi:hypothetical protein
MIGNHKTGKTSLLCSLFELKQRLKTVHDGQMNNFYYKTSIKLTVRTVEFIDDCTASSLENDMQSRFKELV